VNDKVFSKPIKKQFEFDEEIIKGFNNAFTAWQKLLYPKDLGYRIKSKHIEPPVGGMCLPATVEIAGSILSMGTSYLD
jgi:hypothetical protein